MMCYVVLGMTSCRALPSAALSQVAKDVWGTMEAGYTPKPGAGYTAADYAAAVKAILDSPYKAVNKKRLEAALGSQPGVALEVLEAMVQANLLALRPYSPWARDIDPEAFGPGRRSMVVTAPSALHLYLMQVELDTLLAALDNVQVRKAACCSFRHGRLLQHFLPSSCLWWAWEIQCCRPSSAMLCIACCCGMNELQSEACASLRR
jgi:hypothetical protein